MIFFIILAIPAFFLEVVVGQYTGLGATEVWKIAPIFKGVGIATLVLNFMVTSYYHVSYFKTEVSHIELSRFSYHGQAFIYSIQ